MEAGQASVTAVKPPRARAVAAAAGVAVVVGGVVAVSRASRAATSSVEEVTGSVIEEEEEEEEEEGIAMRGVNAPGVKCAGQGVERGERDHWDGGGGSGRPPHPS